MAAHEERIVVPAGEHLEITLSPVTGKTLYKVEVAKDASLTLLLASTYADDAFRLVEVFATVGQDASFHLIDRALGGARLETQVTVALAASGASGKVTGMYHGKNQQHHACHVIMQHDVPHTHGDVCVRGVYEGRARAVFTGLIKIEPGAQQTRSYYRDDVLLLDDALAYSLPTLEIEANDVKASHGSTTSRINDEQMFYLTSRGIPAHQARNLLVAGFLTPALKRVPEALCRPFLSTD
ncbi:MAG: SufD family Fe-S cluster assembly protein [bacterium]|nr:SufD family Fe-S cluster assembly protein [bacterium]